MTEFKVCSTIHAIDLVNKVVNLQIDTYQLDGFNVALAARINRSEPYSNYENLTDLIIGLSRENGGIHVVFSDRVRAVLNDLFAGASVPETYTEIKPSLTITSYTLDSQSFEFTTDRGIYRVKESKSIERAYQELVLLLNDAGIDTSWILFAH